MLSREEYERIVEVFLVELNHLCAEAPETDLRALARFSPEIDGYLEGLRDPENDASQALRVAFAYVDEYIGADWGRVASAGYAAYKSMQAKAVGGASDA